MSGRVLRFGGSAHADVDRLLPWLVNGTLQGEELERVRAHLAGCAACQREEAWLRSLQEACRTEDAATAPSRRAVHRRGRPAIHHALRRRAWQHWVIAVQAVLVLVLGVALLRPERAPPAAYHTLSAPDASRARLVVVFAPSLSEARMRQLLRACDARVVDGPTAAGAWVLSVPAARATPIREALRAAQGVTLVASLDAGR
ncbi:MAG TPA: zf-HC2 domain-containing protein [Frateuria sp.]|uniref:zf-HC2 domain-containing protein n=1 Tax=Frateuria sp. TaxID=2211372 RepID=UPI002D7FBB72|nr:zf-HC2 domain-containing protein [Frateuria sp.]HET6804043.1 zf-HC2 domain-containing protein [Frateuria sp.]